MPSENSRLDARMNGKIISGAKLQQPDRILIAPHQSGALLALYHAPREWLSTPIDGGPP
jgi:hypothetical protein